MLPEADIYTLLVKRGYVRRVVKDAADIFAVEYEKQGDSNISAQYLPIKEAVITENEGNGELFFRRKFLVKPIKGWLRLFNGCEVTLC